MQTTDPKYRRMVENMVAAFRGIPEDTSRATLREVTDIGDAILEGLKRHRISLDKTLPEDALRARWRDLVGPAAPFSHVARIEGKVLTVITNHAVVRSEMMHHQAVIIARVRGVNGCEHVEQLQCRAG